MTVAAILEEHGYRKDQIAGMTRWYVLRVLQHPRRDDEARSLAPAYHEQPGERPSSRQRRRAKLRDRKYPEHLIPWVLGEGE